VPYFVPGHYIVKSHFLKLYRINIALTLFLFYFLLLTFITAKIHKILFSTPRRLESEEGGWVVASLKCLVISKSQVHLRRKEDEEHCSLIVGTVSPYYDIGPLRTSSGCQKNYSDHGNRNHYVFFVRC
jgi:hypothetical protein